MRESAVWRWVQDHPAPGLAIERLEVKFPPGLCDCFWTDTDARVSGWLELKYCEPGDKELRAGKIPKLRPAQPLFLRRQAANGVPSGLLLRVGMVGWYFWLASPEHEWANRLRTEPFASGMAARWGFKEFGLGDVRRYLIEFHRSGYAWVPRGEAWGGP